MFNWIKKILGDSESVVYTPQKKEVPNNLKWILTLLPPAKAQINIIKLHTTKYKQDIEVISTAFNLGLTIMEDIATNQARYYKEDEKGTREITWVEK
jgi:hypothetical protein